MSRNWTYEEVEALYHKWRPDEVDGAGLLILVADSDNKSRASFSDSLFRNGYDPVEAADGLEALKLIRDRQPVACVLCLELEKVGGLDVLEAIRRDDRHRHVPVVAVTACHEKRVAVVARRSGAQAVVFKPCKPDEVIAKLQKLVADE